MASIFQTVRPLKSKKVAKVLGNKKSREKFLDALYKMKGESESESFKVDDDGDYKIKTVSELNVDR
ncbi:MAG: hypothetical protein GY950_37495 [bacterium]|nr:hypothetical protein [bacterium]